MPATDRRRHDPARDLLDDAWTRLPNLEERLARGRAARRETPRSTLSRLTTSGARDPLGILARQNETRQQDLVPLRTERMSASPFAFYRGTAALMAADQARDPHSGILVASCGDAHLSNFGFYASPQRTLMFDLNDFDEAAWAPWEWDVKRLVASIVIGGQATSRDATVVRDAALAAVRAYARSMASGARRSPVDRYFQHFNAGTRADRMDKASRRVTHRAIRDAERRTGERAARRITVTDERGRLRFVERPPTMTHVAPEVQARVQAAFDAYRTSAGVDIRAVLEQYTVSDMVRRVVGVGSVGTRCFLNVLQDGDGNALLLQTKEAGRSVLIEHGGIDQPAALAATIEEHGEGARVVSMQRVLQAFSDPFLGYLKAAALDVDYYVRQFHDMKGGIEVETLDDVPFVTYAQACALALARAHGQSPTATEVAGYIGNGRVVGESLLEWAYAYADLSTQDFEAFVAASPPAG